MRMNLSVAILLAAIIVIGALVVSAKAYNSTWNYISKPGATFEESMDVYGGVWDGYMPYYPEGSIDLLSGNWRANLRIGGQEAWIDNAYFTSTLSTVTPSSIVSTLVNTAPNPYGLPAGVITIEVSAAVIPGTTYLGLRGYRYVQSDPWVMEESYTVQNTGSSILNDAYFYMYYFSSPYGIYPTNNAYVSHADYSVGIPDPMGFKFDITMYGDGTAARWAYTGLSANVPPIAWDVGHGGGYPDPPYYTPSASRPSAISTDVLRHVENDTLQCWPSYDAPTGSDPNAVAGAMKWYIGQALFPGESWTITVLQSVAPSNATIHSAITPVGGISLAYSETSLSASYVGIDLLSAAIVATLAAAVYVKRVKRRKEKP